MRSFLRSFRGRLVLWSMAVIALALIGFSTALGFATIQRLEASVDRELRERARRGGPGPGMGGPGPGFGPGLGGSGRGGPGLGGPGPQGGFGPGGRQGGRRGPDDPREGLPPGPPPLQSTGDPEIDFLQRVRRVRVLNQSGAPMNRFAEDGAFDPATVARALAGEEVFSQVVFENEPIRVLTVPLRQGGEIAGAVQVARELRDIESIRAVQVRTLLALIPLALIVTAAGAFLLAGRALKPLVQMREAAASIGAGDLKRRLNVEGEDELAQLAVSFNEMTRRLDLSFEEREQAYASLKEAFESQKRFTADASHELRTPLARLQIATSSALQGEASGYRAALETADRAAQNMSRLVRQLLTLAQADAGQLHLRREPFDLRVLVADAMAAFDSSFEVVVPDAPVIVLGDQDHLGRVVTNLLENAIRYGLDKPVSVSIERGNDTASVVVADQGEGIPPEHLPHVFERFYRVNPSRAREDGGCGLGLAIGKSVVEAHGGRIGIESDPGRGTRVAVELPLAVVAERNREVEVE